MKDESVPVVVCIGHWFVDNSRTTPVGFAAMNNFNE